MLKKFAAFSIFVSNGLSVGTAGNTWSDFGDSMD